MSYDISLIDEKDHSVKVENHSEGGTYVVGGITEADLNVTYNYAVHFTFRDLHEKKAKDVIPMMEAAIIQLGVLRAKDYWDSTPGNTGYAVSILLGWAKQYPEATFKVV